MKKIIFLIGMIVSSNSIADTWTGPVTIEDIYVWNSTYINVRVSPFINSESCNDHQGYQVKTGTEAEWVNRMYSQLLAAHMAGKKVSFLLSGCGPKGVIKSISFTQPKTPR
ncbi:hypothetical protein B6A42_08580 [Vibrio coralliilyticus]|nr:hypothetical protein B6A42_08580 [Vibrio coralliilyticus]